jgi:hypothetical protein
MKGLELILVSCLVLGVTGGQAQDYIPFPDSNAAWTVTYNSSDCILWGPPQQIFQYEYGNDTLINGLTYHRLMRTHSYSGYCGGNVDGYAGALRDDTLARKVMFIPSWTADEHILFDFSLEPGDTLHSLLTEGCYNMVLSIIDTVATAGGPRRRFNYMEGSCWYFSFIEGVGSPNGLAGEGGVDSGEDLSCLRVNGTVVWENDFQGCLDSPLGTTGPPVAGYRDRPQAFVGDAVVIISVAGARSMKGRCRIFDALGRTLADQPVYGSLSISTAGWGEGSYVACYAEPDGRRSTVAFVLP